MTGQRWNVNKELTYNGFHLRRISDALNKRETPLNPDTGCTMVSMNTTDEERLWWIQGSLSELQFEGFEFGDGTVKQRHEYFKREVQNLKNACLWYVVLKQELKGT